MQMVIESDVFACMIENATSWFNLRNIRVHTHISAYCSYWKIFFFIFMLEIKFIYMYFVLITLMYLKKNCYFINFKITLARCRVHNILLCKQGLGQVFVNISKM